jgi:isoquinoline 1-oxidoreductase beta subunit
MLTAVVARPPVFGAKVKSFDIDEVKGIPGVRYVAEVLAAWRHRRFWAAKQARDKLKVVWDDTGGAKISSDSLRTQYLALAKTPGTPAKQAGDPNAIKAAAKTVVAEYDVPYLAHAPMEPLNCTVLLTADACKIWAGTQFQTVDRNAAAKVADLKPEQVQITTMLAGGGFGRRAVPDSDYVVEAVHVSSVVRRATEARPAGGARGLDREDDIRAATIARRTCTRSRRASTRTASHRLEPGHRRAVDSGRHALQAMMVKRHRRTSVEGAMEGYAIPNVNISLHSPKPGIPVLWWRSVGNTHTAFVKGNDAGQTRRGGRQDPLEYRKSLLAGRSRFSSR